MPYSLIEELKVNRRLGEKTPRVYFQRIIRRYITENITLRNNRCENREDYIV
jgi:hypothetical protein